MVYEANVTGSPPQSTILLQNCLTIVHWDDGLAANSRLPSRSKNASFDGLMRG